VPYLISALVLVGAVCAVNLLLAFAMLRRLRQHAEILRQGRPAAMFDPQELSGQPVPEFAVATTDGGVVNRNSLVARAHLVGFFTPGCGPCLQQVPEFTRAVSGQRRGAPLPLAVVVTRTSDATELIDLLGGVPIVAGDDGVELASRFGIRNYPTMLLTRTDGTIGSAAVSMRGLPVPA
jgi:thiol-disulfide isomerase/thioredoxin